jgi:hypothetical protein
MGLSLTGMRIGPLDLDPKYKSKPYLIGKIQEVVHPENSTHQYKPEILKVTLK